MKFLLYVVLSLFLTICSCTPQKSRTVEALQFKDTIYFFDTIQAQQTEYLFHFTYYNCGSSPLYLIDAKPECGCTFAEIDTDALSPGDSAQINVYYQSYTQSFHVEQSIRVRYFYNDQESEKRIYFKGYVIPRVLNFD